MAPSEASAAPPESAPPASAPPESATAESATAESTLAGPVPVDPRLLEILVCPVTHAPLEYDRAANELISRSAKLAYPIRDGAPIMLPEEARQLD